MIPSIERLRKLELLLIPSARMDLVENQHKPEVELYRAKLAELELEAQERIKDILKHPKHPSRCLWYKCAQEGVSFVTRTPENLKCFKCLENRSYLSCETYMEREE